MKVKLMVYSIYGVIDFHYEFKLDYFIRFCELQTTNNHKDLKNRFSRRCSPFPPIPPFPPLSLPFPYPFNPL